jgi:hypothetical protein
MARVTTRRLTSTAVGLALVGGLGVAMAGTAQADPNANITICHATGTPDKWVVLTVDADGISRSGHTTHQDGRDIIPPFGYVDQSSGEAKSFDGQHWADNWQTDAAGVALEDVDKTMCASEDDTTPPGDTTTPPGDTTTPPGDTTTPPAVTPPGAVTPPAVTGPVVETDLVDPARPSLPLVGGGAALLFAGAGATLVAARRRDSLS